MIRRARPEEADQLTQLALRSKAHWGYDAEFMAACRDELTITADDTRAYPTHVALAGDEIVGFYRLEPCDPFTVNEDRVELGHLFVEPRVIGTGLGRRLMEHALEQARHAGHAVMVIHGDPHAEAFYTASGARKVGMRPSASIPGRLLPVFEIDL